MPCNHTESQMLAKKFEKSPLFKAVLALANKPFGDEPPAGGAPTTTPPAKTEEPKSFSLEYVRELREENKATRLARQELENRLKTIEDELSKTKKDGDEKVSAAQKAADERLLRAELKAAAVKAGLVDMDVLKLVDISPLKLNENGEIEGLDKLVEDFKKTKPHFFGAAGASTSAPGTKPAPKGGNDPVDVTKMSPQDYAAYKAKMLGR